ncbi:MAG: 50S ribosomal protein L10 [Anaerolineae bacterium]|nr:MAG: 50S ribosomal protein L10 [Anaerolineae bacterium]
MQSHRLSAGVFSLPAGWIGNSARKEDDSLAISKAKKQELVAQYRDWIERSQALVVTTYIGLSVPELETLRREVRSAGGEFHVLKNTLARRAFRDAGLEIETEHFLGDTAVAFAFEDAPGVAKAVVDFAKEAEAVRVKAGYLDKRLVSADEIEALAKVPPLPVVRGQLLGVIMAPASKLVRTLAEPGRQIAAVLDAYAKKDAAPEAA